MRTHADNRRIFFGDIFDLPDGDLNVVKLKRHVPIAWHRHQYQTDKLFVVQGRVRVGIDGCWFTLREGCTLVIPSNSWHGYSGLTRDAILVQYNSPKYNPRDEERHPMDDEMPWDAK